jgi:hypothetical protein
MRPMSTRSRICRHYTEIDFHPCVTIALWFSVWLAINLGQAYHYAEAKSIQLRQDLASISGQLALLPCNVTQWTRLTLIGSGQLELDNPSLVSYLE